MFAFYQRFNSMQKSTISSILVRLKMERCRFATVVFLTFHPPRFRQYLRISQPQSAFVCYV